MRTNIVLDDTLIKEAIRGNKREVIHLALQELVRQRREQQMPRRAFISTYLQNPIQLPGFTPMEREDIYAR
ncbi:type II toxin-antitoxin system VapB family antitoxin [Candidatus Thiothrix sp. Deng01]|uniref:Type II toxin-antitoxin system VapB family antitoxin n=1 Tax=Candidatus Thiothrix phosphatis TaxID=3112415 RepID=A0ABU6D1Q9_9GAMM|nr:type II toxin-antitoxin system VapB family antitoxin [Candidatus Thiothrix sp. Deng01]MEB4592980.1 type II toxin-antitoxin system VapB family antitoxin [Candidatus Thiothrix sp. Deng01]